MRRILLTALAMGVCCVPSPAVANPYPSRQECTMNLTTNTASQPIATGTVGRTWEEIDLVGTTSCSLETPQPAELKLFVWVDGCTSATGWGELYLKMNGTTNEVNMLNFQWAGGAASFYLQTPYGPGAVEAQPASDLANGVCFRGLGLYGPIVYHLWAGTLWDDGG